MREGARREGNLKKCGVCERERERVKMRDSELQESQRMKKIPHKKANESSEANAKAEKEEAETKKRRQKTEDPPVDPKGNAMNFLEALTTWEVSAVSVLTEMSEYHSGLLDLGTACLYLDEAILDMMEGKEGREGREVFLFFFLFSF